MEGVPMSNLKIKDIETLETLVVEDLDKVVGGNMCPNNNFIAIGKPSKGNEVDIQSQQKIVSDSIAGITEPFVPT